jgi:UDP-N-acetylglucosamine 2-epimerase (non-hydrolysing)
MKLIYIIAGARPNFMKIAPIIRALKTSSTLKFKLIHTGQHYDREMNDVFFEELGIPAPDVFMGAGGGTHAQQTAKIMVGFEEICLAERPHLVLVVGDVNSTLACSIVAKKLNIPVAHVEAGLRSGDMSMPEEINRMVTDSITDYFFVTEPSGVDHLIHEGHAPEHIHYVGHVMVDNIYYQREQLSVIDSSNFQSTQLKKQHGRYGVVTLHRPSNVDSNEHLQAIGSALRSASEKLPLIFPVHPRTQQNLEKFGIELGQHIILTQPLSYMDFLNLWKDACLVLTDSGGLQEETTALGVPCITMRNNTERPITVEEGTNVLVGTDPSKILDAVSRVLSGDKKTGKTPHLWDGKAAERIISVLEHTI